MHTIARLDQARADHGTAIGLPPQKDQSLELAALLQRLVFDGELRARFALTVVIDSCCISAQAEVWILWDFGQLALAFAANYQLGLLFFLITAVIIAAYVPLLDLTQSLLHRCKGISSRTLSSQL